MDKKIMNTIASLEKNKIKARYFETGKEAVAALMIEIGNEDKVGIGGSMTIKNLGIPEIIRDRGNELFYHWFETTPEGITSARMKALHSDIYITSTNALTEDGVLINMDGTGNRVAAMIYGPKKVFVLSGMNKIVKNESDGIKRIENNAWKNAVRMGLNTPCVKVQHCVDCSHPHRMCNALTIIRKKTATDLTVFIIGEELGH